MASVSEILERRSIAICAGSGGVGKTTASAALAAGLAARGQKVAVLTIDPAKRLADSLGLDELENEPRRVDPRLFDRAGVEMRGELWAMMLDAKATFDDLVRKHAPDAETRDRILKNRIYRQISNALAGSQEYMAMEKLFEIHQEGRYDFLVLDTPPSRNALDFLDAPKRLTQFIEGRGMQMFMKPTGFATRVVGKGSSMAFGVLKRVVGIDLLADLGEFFQAFSGMVSGFQERAKRVSELLADPATTFLIVCGPQGEPIEEAVYFHRKLVEAKLPVGGVIVNKVHYETEADLRGGAARDLRRRPRRAGGGQLRRLPGPRSAGCPQRQSPRSGARCKGGDPHPLHGRGHPRPRGPAEDRPLSLRHRGAAGSACGERRLSLATTLVAKLAHVPVRRVGNGEQVADFI
jgi:anion-transporting  ArsA/GET3 family ATPase